MGGRFIHTSGAARRESDTHVVESCASVEAIIASAAKQTTLSFCCTMDCFAALAMTAF
jgi:hypothetical protein